MAKRLTRDFYNKNCDVLAKDLLGMILCKKIDDTKVLRGRIVETEMYPGSTDQASHSFDNKKTKRNGAMFMVPGTAYVYFIYGMYFCFNISSQEPGGCVLIRALEPVEGLDVMRVERSKKSKSVKDKDLCNGPSKLCQALSINKENSNEVDLTSDSSSVWLEEGLKVEEDKIVTSKRIGINSYGSSSADKPYRFYEQGNANVSVFDQNDEHSPKKKRKKSTKD